jgi:hypothetical protein
MERQFVRSPRYGFHCRRQSCESSVFRSFLELRNPQDPPLRMLIGRQHLSYQALLLVVRPGSCFHEIESHSHMVGEAMAVLAMNMKWHRSNNNCL